MHPILFQVGNLTFYTHGVLAVIGIVVGTLLIYRLAGLAGQNREFFFDNIVFTVLFGIIGARIAYFLVYFSDFDSWTKIFYLWEGGLVSYGGFLFGVFTFIILLRRQGQTVAKWLDLGAIGFFPALLIGRIGDIFAGEYAGRLATSRLLSIFPGNNLIAIPFFEAVLCLLIFIFTIISYRKIQDRLGSGIIFLGSFFLYGIGRFIIDFGREEKDLLLHLSLGQVMSLMVVVIMSYFIVLGLKERSQHESV